ncbi:MAG: carboxylate-amine ligase, partial [Magnetovibrio sp.]|nr:carboxylate-amine ligase [Magnetovibrio sp.]
DIIIEDAEALDCRDELAHVTTILDTGTSAHHQCAVFETAKGIGVSDEDAYKAVVDWLIATTVEDL